MGLVRLTNPTMLISPSGARVHLRIDHVEDDALLAGMLEAATDYFERETRTALGAADYRLTLDSWPSSRQLRLPRPPLIGIDSISYRNADGQYVPLPSGAYVVDDAERPARVVLIGELPPVAAYPGAIRVNYRAGYETPETAPATLLHGVKMMVGHFYELREPVVVGNIINEVPLAVQSIIWQHAMPEVF